MSLQKQFKRKDLKKPDPFMAFSARFYALFEKNKTKWISHPQCDFGYRESIFKKKNLIILGAEFILREGNKNENCCIKC